MDIEVYLSEIRALYASGQTTEHSFRPALAALFKAIDPALTVINEPKHITDVGAPDFVFYRDAIAIGWCEAKDIGKEIRKFAANEYSKSQKERYKKGLPNLIYTNGIDFEFIREGEIVDFIRIADNAATLPALPLNFVALANRLRDFATTTPLSITSSKRLAEMMAGKAAIVKDIMGRALTADITALGKGAAPTDLYGQYEAFKSNLIPDITVADFADIYAETIAYGLFAARLHDDTQDGFTRAEALELLPKSNPFLRQLFIYIAGPNLDERLRRVIDELCNLFAATNMSKIMANFGKLTAKQDPFLHFYEVFLAEYNPTKRKARGVWFTPEPVVSFIVRAVDDVLKSEFGLPDGLADTGRITIDWDTGQNDKGKPLTLKKQVHRVQILDPATGTGTFLAEVVKVVAQRVKGIAPGHWSKFVEQDLIPRVHGFELLMASYAMCHMKLDMILTGLGYKPSESAPRLGVYLTNSLDEGERVEQTLFGLSRAIAEEAKFASDIKRQTPIMVVVGNPPYAGHSSNKGDWLDGLLEAYKYEPGSKQRLQERNPKWINDDYVKFIRFAEHMIVKNSEGVLGFITAHGYLDNPTFRGMRWHLLDAFDTIYVLDLHGNVKKKEVSPDGSPDKNVFDIQQGVAIIIAVKRRREGKKGKSLADVWHGDLWGSREAKSAALWSDSLASREWNKVSSGAPQYYFVAKDFERQGQYDEGFAITDLMPVRVLGFQTHRDAFAVADTREELLERLTAMRDPSITDNDIKVRWALRDNRDWQLAPQRKRLSDNPDWQSPITACLYRPFDIRSCHLGYETMDYPRTEILQHVLHRNNISLLLPRQLSLSGFQHVLVTDLPAESCAVSAKTKEQNQVFPLYLFPQDATLDQTILVNFEPKLYARIRKAAGLGGPTKSPSGTDSFRKASGEARPDEVKVLDYVYGVLHDPAYRTKFSAFLKIDFPRILFPSSPEMFKKFSARGERLRRLHLMEDGAIGDTPYAFHGEGDSMVGKSRFESSRIYINATQYFDSVPEQIWNFLLGGYHSAQKWLKERKGVSLGWNDVRHYQKLIKILAETDRIMHSTA